MPVAPTDGSVRPTSTPVNGTDNGLIPLRGHAVPRPELTSRFPRRLIEAHRGHPSSAEGLRTITLFGSSATRPRSSRCGQSGIVDDLDNGCLADLGMLKIVHDVVVRDAKPADLVVLQDVFRRSSLSNDGDRAHLLAHPELLEWTPPPANRGRTRVAVVDDAIVGFATTTVGPDFLELDDLFVDPEWMKLGVGRTLVLDATTLARDRDVLRIEVTAHENALRFYERVGFVSHDIVETRFGPAPRMHLELAPHR
jgi:GNAT superfamily N-acetyltransferase